MSLLARVFRRSSPPPPAPAARRARPARSVTVRETRAAVEQFREIHAAYNAARDNIWRRKREGILPSGSGHDYHYRSDADYLEMVELARDFDRNDPVVCQAVSRLVENIVREGFVLDPQTGDTELDQELAARFRE